MGGDQDACKGKRLYQGSRIGCLPTQQGGDDPPPVRGERRLLPHTTGYPVCDGTAECTIGGEGCKD